VTARSRKAAFAGTAAAVALAALGLPPRADVLAPGSAQSQPETVQGLPSDTSIVEGPGGRTALTRWTLRSDPRNRGLAHGWSRGRFAGASVAVPGVVNPGAVTGRAGLRNWEGSVAWYRTTLTVAQAGVYAVSFTSASYLATVWVDGQRLGSHAGEYVPFEFRHTLGPGRHTLVVRVDWRTTVQHEAGEHSAWFNFGGIDGEVSVREIGPSELLAPAIQTRLEPDAPNATRATVQIAVGVRNDGPTRTIAPQGELQHGAQTIPLSFSPLEVAAGQTVTMSATATVENPALWSPTQPNLYELTIAVGRESSWTAHVGLRQLSWSEGRLLLNGQPLLLHGASLQEEAPGHGDALSAADQQTLIGELKAIGANATRSQHPLDPGLLERLDAAGILVWQGIGPVYESGAWPANTPALLAADEQNAQTTVRQAELHPSIVAWNLVNELAHNGHRGGREALYIETMARWLHAFDPGRMVAVDVWGDHPPKHAGPLYAEVDAVSETDYSGWYDRPRDTPEQLAAMIARRLAAMHATFPGKVQIISEFGAESNALNPPASPGGYTFQSQLLATHIGVYEHDPQLSGMLVWNLRDYALTPRFAGGSIRRELPHVRLVEGLNEKGLFDYDGNAKPAAAVVAQLFAGLPAE